MLKRSYKTYLLIIVVFIGSYSCKTTSSNERLNIQKLENTLLWKVEGKGLEDPSYLFGTIHIISKEDYFLPDGFLSAFDAVKKVFFEINVDDMTDMSKVMGLMDKIMMNDNKTLKDLLSTEDYNVVDENFKKIGMPLLFMERMKPMFLEVFAISDFNPGDIQNGSMKSYEFELNDLAKESNKLIGGLESIEFQLSVFDSIPYKYQAERLVSSIKLGSENSGSLDELVKIYKSMDVDAMVTMMEEEDAGIKGFEDLLLNNRNKNWIPLMEEAMNKESCFFAVGAAHLGGENGVIRLLKQKGYKVTGIMK